MSELEIKGGDGDDTFTLDRSVAAAGVPVSLDGAAGNNAYKVGDNFGNVTVVGSGDVGNDTLDFTSGTDARIEHPDSATFKSGSGGTLTLSGAAPVQIDLSLADPVGFKDGVRGAIDQIVSTVGQVAATAPEFSNALPLLDPSAGSSVDQLLGLGDSFRALAASAGAALGSLAPASVSDVVHVLQTIVPGLPQALRGLIFSSAYASSGGHLLVYIVMRMARADASTCVNGSGCIRKAIAMSLGGSGLQVDADASTDGVQAPMLNVGAALGVNLAAGVDFTSGGPAFVRPDGSIEVAVNAAIPNLTAVVSDGSNQATVSGAINLAGALALALVDPTAGDNGIVVSELSRSVVTLTCSGVAAPIVLTGTGAGGGTATLTILLGGGSIFGSGAGPALLSAGLALTGSSAAEASASSAGSDPTESSGSVQVDGGSSSTVSAPADTTISGSTSSSSESSVDASPSADTTSATATSGSTTSSTSGSDGSTSAPTSSDPAAVTTDSTTGTQATSTLSNTDVSTTGAGTNGASSSSSGSSTSGTTSTTPTDSSDTTTTPVGADSTSPDPTANTASGLSPPAPAPWTISLSDGSTHTISVAADATNVSVTVDGLTTSRPLAQVSSLSITSGAGNDSFTIGAISIPVSLDGGDGTDTLNGPAADSSWSITGLGGGTVGGVAFAGFENVAGAPNNKDTFVFGPTGSLAGIVDGGADGFDSIEFDGTAATIVATITAIDSGTVLRDGVLTTYAGMEPAAMSCTTCVVDGTSGSETFTIKQDADPTKLDVVVSSGETHVFTNIGSTLNLTIDGKEGDDTLILQSLPAAFIGQLVFDGGDGNDTLIGKASGSTWTLDGTDSGTLDGASFSAIENLMGGDTGADSFTIGDPAKLDGIIDGGAGAGDTVTGPDVDTTWEITSANAGATLTVHFTRIEQLVGGSAVDAFSIDQGAWISGGINGGGGSDAIVAPNTANQWLVGGANAGTVTVDTGGTPTSTVFASIENLIGGNKEDSFFFNGSGSIDGLLDGGPTDADADPQPVDKLELSGHTGPASVRLTGGAATIEYAFSTATADADPGSGTIRLDSATQNAATTLRADVEDSSTSTVAALLDAFDDPPGVVKGELRLTDKNDATNWLSFSVTAVATPGQRLPQHLDHAVRVQLSVAVRRRRDGRTDVHPARSHRHRRRRLLRERRHRSSAPRRPTP